MMHIPSASFWFCGYKKEFRRSREKKDRSHYGSWRTNNSLFHDCATKNKERISGILNLFLTDQLPHSTLDLIETSLRFRCPLPSWTCGFNKPPDASGRTVLLCQEKLTDSRIGLACSLLSGAYKGFSTSGVHRSRQKNGLTNNSVSTFMLLWRPEKRRKVRHSSRKWHFT
jgi:hypothetical protein